MWLLQKYMVPLAITSSDNYKIPDIWICYQVSPWAPEMMRMALNPDFFLRIFSDLLLPILLNYRLLTSIYLLCQLYEGTQTAYGYL